MQITFLQFNNLQLFKQKVIQSVNEISAHMHHKLLQCIHVKFYKTVSFSRQTQVNSALQALDFAPGGTAWIAAS